MLPTNLGRAQSSSSLSRRVSIKTSTKNSAGRRVNVQEVLNPKNVRRRKDTTAAAEALRVGDLTAAQRRAEDAFRDSANFQDDADESNNNLGAVLEGASLAEISHEGEDLTPQQIANKDALDEARAWEDLQESHNRLYAHRHDYRTRRNRTQDMVDAFAPQMPAMADAYIAWDLRCSAEGLGVLLAPPSDAMVQGMLPMVVVDIFGSVVTELPMLIGDAFVTSGLVELGYFPCSPNEPNVVITTRTLEIFRVAHLRCPRLAIQPYVKTLCDIDGVPFRPYLSNQFSIAFDLYLATRAIVDQRVKAVLGRDTPDWRLKNACPPCVYKLEGEPPLPLPFLCTMDGNNSLKRFHRRERDVVREEGGATAREVPGESKERKDNRTAPGDYYLTREEVNKWAEGGIDELMRGFVPDPEWVEEDDGRRVTGKAWGLYEETGVFLSLCRHGFVLLITDMVRSGELSKYGFAVIEHLIRTYGEVACGYDIGCKFGKTVNKHPILGPLARANQFRSLVGAFHGHGHNRLCQLCNLATYVKGIGLEDLEYCETFFSKSNALAPSTRYCTSFHRQQAIAAYLQHTDVFDTYQSLSLLLANKYKRALEMKRTAPALEETMRQLGIDSGETFAGWLAAEMDCLRNLSKEPLEETLAMEYYQKLVNLAERTERMQNIMAITIAPVDVADQRNYADAAKRTRRVESQRRHAMELHGKALLAVQDLELRLEVEVRWVAGSPEWEAVATLVSKRRYQRALDNLQGLIISRMFELTKMNMSGTGYKLRKHIAKALQARSHAVKTALATYNVAAAALDAPRDALTWEQVVEYAFLSDFDLLRDGRHDIREELWAKPSGRAAMDQYFKLQRADEEIFRLNIEIPRFVTYMRDEDAFLEREEIRVWEEHGAALAHQVLQYAMRQGRFNDSHMLRLIKLSHEPGFTASLTPGVAVNKERLAPGPTLARPFSGPARPLGDDDERDDDDEADALAEQMSLLQVAQDSAAARGVQEGGRD
ncbi:hypothetical protein C8J57DRAFT_1577441 [Mycena rebaudengoi]|nr:hypothetical protein C8J57DRAFT_1577441 [Mycena rebaudengoi]